MRIKEGRVAKASQPTLANMTRVLIEELKQAGFDAEENKNACGTNSKAKEVTCIDVAEFEENIKLELGSGAKYKIIPNMPEIDFDLEGKGMDTFRADACDLAQELAKVLAKEYEDSSLDESVQMQEDFKAKDLSKEIEDSCEAVCNEIREIILSSGEDIEDEDDFIAQIKDALTVVLDVFTDDIEKGPAAYLLNAYIAKKFMEAKPEDVYDIMKKHKMGFKK